MHTLDAFIENANLPIIITDLSGLITHINAAAKSLYELITDEALGQHVSMFSPQYARAEYERAAWQVAQEGRATEILAEQCTARGKLMTVRLFISPIRDEQGALTGISRIAIDTTASLAIQSNLQKERDLLDGILETTTDANIMIDSVGRVVTANLQFESFFHLARYLIVGQPFETLIETIRSRSDLPSALINLMVTYGKDNYQSAGGEFETEPPERRVLIWYSAPVHAHDGSTIGRLFVFRDATREREVDRMKTEFVSLVSHELRTPLTAIKGFAEFILDGDAGEVNAEARSYLEIIHTNADRLMRLIRDILDLTRIEAGRMDLHCEHYTLDQLVQEATDSVRHMLDEHKQELRITLEDGLPPVWADRERMVQILTNLLSNAIKYSPNGSKIRIGAHIVRPDDTLPPGALLYVYQPAVLIGVHDYGMGIAQEDQPNVFSRFFRTEQASQMQIQGSGLGLAIVKSFVELHGGKIWVHSDLGRGTSFYFTIPLVEGV